MYLPPSPVDMPHSQGSASLRRQLLAIRFHAQMVLIDTFVVKCLVSARHADLSALPAALNSGYLALAPSSVDVDMPIAHEAKALWARG